MKKPELVGCECECECEHCVFDLNSDIKRPCISYRKDWITNQEIREIMCHLIRNYEIHEQLTILNQCIKDGDFTLIKGY